MDYKKIVLDNYTIHFIQNKKFHTIDFRVFFSENVTEEKITYRNALVSLLTMATKKYDTKEKLIKRCQDLYSLSPSAFTTRNGNLLSTRFSISTINSSYVDKDNIKENILLLKEIILNPLATDKKFNDKYFDIIKKELIAETKTIAEEPRLYANINLIKMLNTSGNILSGYCELDLLDKMNTKNLYQSYLEMLNNSKIDIFVAGNVNNINEITKLIKDNFVFHNKYQLNEGMINHSLGSTNVLIKEETKNYQQSKLAIGYKMYNLTNYENRYVSFVFNNLFGGGANSLLMRYVRENESLCYYVNSFTNRLDNIIFVNSGINKENYEKVKDLINDVLNKIANGKFTLSDLAEAKMEMLFSLSTMEDSNRNMIEYYFGRELFKSDELKVRIENTKKVSKEDIMTYAKKIKLEAVFFLKGDL